MYSLSNGVFLISLGLRVRLFFKMLIKNCHVFELQLGSYILYSVLQYISVTRHVVTRHDCKMMFVFVSEMEIVKQIMF